jgi:hypothetical protein
MTAVAQHSGTYAECFKHLWDSGFATDHPRRRLFSKLVGIGSPTLNRWASGKMPTGEPRLRLMGALDFMGYEVTEFNELRQATRRMVELITFQILDVGILCDITGRTKPHMMAVLRGDNITTPEVAGEFHDVWERLGGEIDRMKKAYDALLTETKDISEPRFENTDDFDIDVPRAEIINHLAGLINKIVPVAEEVASDGFTADERRVLRTQTVDGGIFRLINALTSLSGEMARKVRK